MPGVNYTLYLTLYHLIQICTLVGVFFTSNVITVQAVSIVFRLVCCMCSDHTVVFSSGCASVVWYTWNFDSP